MGLLIPGSWVRAPRWATSSRLNENIKVISKEDLNRKAVQNFDTCNKKNKFHWSFQWKSKKKQRFIHERTIEPNGRNPQYSPASSVGRAWDPLYQGRGFEPTLGGDFLKLNENIKVNPEKNVDRIAMRNLETSN